MRQTTGTATDLASGILPEKLGNYIVHTVSKEAELAVGQYICNGDEAVTMEYRRGSLNVIGVDDLKALYAVALDQALP